MKRVAVCISGQPRFYRKTAGLLFKNVIRPNNADVFMHFWHDKDSEGNTYVSDSWTAKQSWLIEAGLEDNLVCLYAPKKYKMEKERQVYPEDKDQSHYNNRWCPQHHLFPMFYSIMESNKLKTEYERENGFVYDAVFRMRFDVAILDTINVGNCDLSKINFPDWDFENRGQPCDYFMFSNSHNMDVASDTYSHLDRYFNESKVSFCGESMFLRHTNEERGIGWEPCRFSFNLLRNDEFSRLGVDYRTGSTSPV